MISRGHPSLEIHLFPNKNQKTSNLKETCTTKRHFDRCTVAEKGLPTSDFRPRTSDFRLQTSDFRLRTSDFGLPTSDFRLQTSDFRLRTSDFGLPTSDFRLQTSDFRLRTSDFGLPTSDFRLSYNKVVHPIDKEMNKLNSKRGSESNENNACEKFE